MHYGGSAGRIQSLKSERQSAEDMTHMAQHSSAHDRCAYKHIFHDGRLIYIILSFSIFTMNIASGIASASNHQRPPLTPLPLSSLSAA